MKSLQWMVTLVACAFFGCGGTPDVQKSTTEEHMALGWLERGVLQEGEYHVFEDNYDTVKVEGELVNLIQQLHEEIEITVFLGTWCSDSKREVPRFFKIVDLAGISGDRIKLYGVDRSKKSGDGLTDKHGIQRVPTFIFFKDGVEIGRITEKPHSTLEADMLSILAAAQSK